MSELQAIFKRVILSCGLVSVSRQQALSCTFVSFRLLASKISVWGGHMQGPEKQMSKQVPLLLFFNPSDHFDSGRQLIFNIPISAGRVLVLEIMAVPDRKMIAHSSAIDIWPFQIKLSPDQKRKKKTHYFFFNLAILKMLNIFSCEGSFLTPQTSILHWWFSYMK